MDPYAAQPIRRNVAQEVRGNAFWAAIAAALFLCYSFGTGLSVPEGETGAWAIGGHILVWTLKIGGIGFVVIALICAAGLIWGLLVDAIFSLLAGFGLILSGAMQYSDGGNATLLHIIFGVVFLAAGKRLWGEYQTLMLLANKAGAVAGDDRRPPAPPMEGRGVPSPIGPPPEELGPAQAEPQGDDEGLPGRLKKKNQDTPPPLPDGYLASFADDHDDESNETDKT